MSSYIKNRTHGRKSSAPSGPMHDSHFNCPPDERGHARVIGLFEHVTTTKTLTYIIGRPKWL